MRIGIIGEFNPNYYTHLALNEAFIHSAEFLKSRFELQWISTATIAEFFEREIHTLDGLLMAMGTPYCNMDAALKVIEYARENNIPLMAICGGFQHVLIEYARNVKGIHDAEHEETSPNAANKIINALSCSLVGEKENLNVIDDNSLTAKILDEKEFEGKYHCSYGLNKNYEKILFDENLFPTVINAENEIRAIELKNHKFFIGTLFQHQLYSTPENPSKLLNAFVKVCNSDV